MGWDKTGSFISGLYLDMFPFSGTVRESRVKYGGQVEHTVELVNPIRVFGATRDVILIEENLDRVFA
jgi:hypothetical protein